MRDKTPNPMSTVEKTYMTLEDLKGYDLQYYKSTDHEFSKQINWGWDDYYALKNAAYELLKTNPEKEVEIQKTLGFEVIKIEYSSSLPFISNSIFIKLPYTNEFIQMDQKGSSGSGGTHHFSLENPWQLNYSKENCVKMHFNTRDWKNAILRIDDQPDVLKRVHPAYINPDVKFVKLPHQIRSIDYAFAARGSEDIYIIDHSKYYFSYDESRLSKIVKGEVINFEVKSFERYRDGGTTIVKWDEDGVEQTFYSPTVFSKHLKPTLNEKPIDYICPELEPEALKLLNLKPGFDDLKVRGIRI